MALWGSSQPMSGKAEIQTCISDVVPCALGCIMWDLISVDLRSGHAQLSCKNMTGVAAKAWEPKLIQVPVLPCTSNYLTSLSLIFLTCKVEIIMPTL